MPSSLNFSAIKAEHFKPAFDIVLKDHKTLITSIASNSDAPTFDNTIKELDKSYIIKSKISSVFSNLCSSLNSPELQLVQAEMAPLLTLPVKLHKVTAATLVTSCHDCLVTRRTKCGII